jgi:hypothetical protein
MPTGLTFCPNALLQRYGRVSAFSPTTIVMWLVRLLSGVALPMARGM